MTSQVMESVGSDRCAATAAVTPHTVPPHTTTSAVAPGVHAVALAEASGFGATDRARATTSAQ